MAQVVARDDAKQWMQDIADQPAAHKLAVTNVVKKQRRLGKWMKLQATHLGAHLGVSSAYMMGVAGRCMELSGATLSACTNAQLDAAAEQVAEAVDALLPPDDGLQERLGAIAWRAQPHILDLLVEDVFKPPEDGEEAKHSPETLVQVFILVWVAVEVLEMCATWPE